MSKSKKRKELDIAELKAASATEFESLDFLFPKHPDEDKPEEKRIYSAYEIKALQEPREFTSKKGNTYKCVDAELLQAKNDDKVEEGKKYTVVLHDVLYKTIMSYSPITGKAFKIMGKGKVIPKKKGKRPYYNFAVLLSDGSLLAKDFQRLLSQK